MTEPSTTHTTQPAPYTPPRLIILGTLHQLTQGGNTGGTPDGFGFAGASGSLP